MAAVNVYDRVTREDVVLFINACFACTGQREFYGDTTGQNVAIAFLHEYMLGNYRRLYARTLAAGINHFNQSQIIFNLLASSRSASVEMLRAEVPLIVAALRSLPPQRALGTLEKLADRRINNRRVRATIRRYLSSRPDPDFDVIKYRKRIRKLAAHAHLKLTDEQSWLLFEPIGQQRKFTTPLFESYRQAHYSQEAVYELPFTVAEGLAARHNIPRERFLQRIEPKMTAGEKLRMQNSALRARKSPQGKSKLQIDLQRTSLTRLCIYLLSLGIAERQSRRAEFEEAIRQATARCTRGTSPLGRVAAVLDRSFSTAGSVEKRRRPLAIALAASQVLQTSAKQYQAFWTPTVDDEYCVQPRGQTDLATPLLAALRWQPDLVVIVSDGYENDPTGAVAEIMRLYWGKLDRRRRTSVIHVNPVFDGENFAPRKISSLVATVGLRDAEELVTMLRFAQFAEGATPLADLEAYLDVRVAEFLARAASKKPRSEFS